VIFDFFVTFPDVNHYDLDAITVPVLIMHATDDPVPSYEAAEHAAGRIPGARLARVEKGGHLMLGPQEAIRAELAASWRHQDRRRPARRRLWGPAASDTVLQHGTAPTPPGMRRLQPVALLGGRQLVRPVGGRWLPPAGTNPASARSWVSVTARSPYPRHVNTDPGVALGFFARRSNSHAVDAPDSA
jgi:hypothetical protein